MAGVTLRRGNLPAEATSFVGRRRELAEVRTRLTEGRLVTLLGPGGVGKTRLALRAARDLARGFAAGAWLVELADVRDPQLVAGAVAAGLDLRDQSATQPRDLVLSYLRERALLLVLDNCEHVLDSVAVLLAQVLAAAPAVRVIATSREPLSVSAEFVVPVPPLRLPPDDRDRRTEAVQLFADRARAASGTFELNADNQDAVVAICRRLDGLPLAIELAAVRTRVLSIEEILGRLDDRFELLTRGNRAALPRHQTLRSAIDWSHDLLTPEERVLFRRISVFAGRFTSQDVEAVAGAGEISSLIDKSLVAKEDVRGVPCQRMHETVREYALIKLRESGEEELVQGQCDTYYLSRCRAAALQARYRLAEWLRWLDLEIDNVRALLRRCLVRRDFAEGLEIVTALGLYWITRGTSEGSRWVKEFLPSARESDPGYAHAWLLLASLALLQGDVVEARAALDRATAVARVEGEAALLSQSLSMASVAANMAGDHGSARKLLSEAQAVNADLNDVAAELGLLQALVLNGLFEGDLDAVRSASVVGADRSRQVGDVYSLGVLLTNRGVAALLTGDLDGARESFREVLGIARELDDRVALHISLGAIGYHAARSGQPKLGAQLLGAAEAIRAEADARVLPPLVPLLSEARQLAAAGLGPSRFDAEFRAGQLLSRHAAIALGLGQPSAARAAPTEGSIPMPLGKREAEVARMVAEGLTNKQIGLRLFISERTVEGHVRSIMNKLGSDSRAQIAAWVSTQQF